MKYKDCLIRYEICVYAGDLTRNKNWGWTYSDVGSGSGVVS